MTEKEEKTKPEEKNKTKDTKETTHEDAMIEEALTKEEPKTEQSNKVLLKVAIKEKGIKTETKTALGAVILLLFSLLFLWISGTRNDLTENFSFIGFIVVNTLVGGLSSLLIARFAAWDKNQRSFLLTPLTILWCIFLLPPLIGITPLSKYHNYNQLERDKKIVEVLEITVLEDYIEVLLPNEHASESSYLKKVFSLGLTNDTKEMWEDIVIPCREGDKYWHKVKLPLPNWYKLKLAGRPVSWTPTQEKDKYKNNTDNIFLFFDHAFKDYETTKEIIFPDPNE